MATKKTNKKETESILLNIINALGGFYVALNQELLFAWRRFLSKQSDNRITHFFKTMIEHPATALFINTILFAAVGVVFGGLIQQVMFAVSAINIIVFCALFLGWKEKLEKRSKS